MKQRPRTGLGFYWDGDIGGAEDVDPYLGYGWFDGGGGGDWRSNFDSEGDYLPGYNWWDNFDPNTGDYVGSGDTIFVGQTDAPAPVPPAGGDWESFLSPWPYSPPPIDSPYGSGPQPAAPGSTLPGYCPAGTYHPMDNPYACVPFPNQGQQGRGQQPGKSGGQQQGKGSSGGSGSQQKPPQPCPKGKVLNMRTGQCVTPPKCPQGLVFDPQRNTCVKPSTANPTAAASLAGWPWWVWALIAGGVIYATSGDGSEGRRRRR